jgi:hypothetical protein
MAAFLFAMALMVCVRPAAGAAAIVVDFEASPGPDGLVGTGDDIPTPSPCIACRSLSALGFGAIGVDFTSGTLFDGNLFPNRGPNNHYSSSSVPDATFSVPVYGISVNSYSVWTLTLYALDSSGAILASDTFINPTGEFALARLAVSSSVPIARFTVRPEGCLPYASRCDRIVNIDDMVFATRPEARPAGSPLDVPSLDHGMLALLALLIVWFAFRQGGVSRPSNR